MSEATLDRPVGEDLLSAEKARLLLAGDLPIPDTSAIPVEAGWAIAPEARAVDRSSAVRGLPRGELSPFQRAFRHWFSRTVSALLMKSWFRITIVGRDRILAEPAMYVFNHLSWTDPLVLLATFPKHPRLHFYGPKEVTLQKGIRNRFMWWTTIPVPFSPHKDDLLTSVRRAQAVFDSGASLAISAEGRIHVHEGDLLPFEDGAAYLALRAGVPIVPVAITGTSWAHFRGRVLVRIGEPIPTGTRPTRLAVARYTALAWHRLRAMVADDEDLPVPGRIERWFTDLVNDWGPGGRAAATEIRGPDPANVPIPREEPAGAPKRR
jgi:1-acyl-sn-glycerol-3-phosphate acyltransferase